MLRSRQPPKLQLPTLEESQNKFHTSRGRKRVDLREEINETESRKVVGKSVKQKGINLKKISQINKHLINERRNTVPVPWVNGGTESMVINFFIISLSILL